MRGPLCAEALSLVVRNQVEMRSMLANIPLRLRNNKSCTREAVLRPLFRERVRALSSPSSRITICTVVPLFLHATASRMHAVPATARPRS